MSFLEAIALGPHSAEILLVWALAWAFIVAAFVLIAFFGVPE